MRRRGAIVSRGYGCTIQLAEKFANACDGTNARFSPLKQQIFLLAQFANLIFRQFSQKVLEDVLSFLALSNKPKIFFGHYSPHR